MKATASLVALAILTLAAPLAQAGLITVTSSRVWYLHSVYVSTGGRNLTMDLPNFPVTVSESQVVVTNKFGQAASTFNAFADLTGSTTEMLTAQFSANVTVRSPANDRPGGVSYEAQAHINSLFSIEFNVNEAVDADYQVLAGVTDLKSLQTGVFLRDPYSDLRASLTNVTTNTTIAAFTTPDTWKGRLDPGRYRMTGRLDLSRFLFGGTTGDPDFTSFINANGVVRSALRVNAVPPVPEPATLSLCTVGAALLGAYRATKRRG